ncbi:MAG: hypothetical protein E7675_04185 [Ruminococcaceae bacterium]|nr:hypothetical protein [Oscillospiraceae bacterium]
MSTKDRYRIAETEIEINSPYDTHRKFCSQYESSSALPPELTINITEADIQGEFEYYREKPSAEYASLSLIYRKLCEYIITKGGFVLHGAVIEYKGFAYAFIAPSGTGKSTHIKNWRKLLGDRVDIVNGDKPIVFYKEGKFYASGTPWAGKEGWQRNVCVPFGSICRVYRGDSNRISEAGEFELTEMLLGATLMPRDQDLLEKLLDNIERFTAEVPAYKLYCTKETESAKVSFEKMTGDSI